MGTIPELAAFDALIIDRIMTSGRTGAILMPCERNEQDEDRIQLHFVVKLRVNKANENGTRGSVNEAFCSLLAHYFDIKTPEPAIINIHPGLEKTTSNTQAAYWVKQSVGENFGSLFVPGAAVFNSNSLPVANIQQALNIFAFDVLVWNVDRTKSNPNLLETPSGLIAYDHDCALAYGLPKSMLNFKLDCTDFAQMNYTEHVLYRLLKGKPELNTTPFAVLLAGLSDWYLDAIVNEIPRSWQGAEIEHILRFLRHARDNAEAFEKKLQGVLS